MRGGVLNSHLPHFNPGHKGKDSFMTSYSSPGGCGIDFKETTTARGLIAVGLSPLSHGYTIRVGGSLSARSKHGRPSF